MDGHHLAWQCCQAISASYAADQLRLQLQQLLRDLPGLEHLRFSDGTPFASQTTRQWIACTPAAAPEATAPNDDASPVEIQQRDGFAAAAAALQRQVQGQPGERPRVIARLELARLHLHNGQADQARALLECIRQQLQANQSLALWGCWPPVAAKQCQPAP
ncbi:type VI secretion system domain-containing protein [Halopseudomonas pachastrellae]|nr:type VI secretion system domain-containing protein [Halopseudomonas pachastrellae]